MSDLPADESMQMDVTADVLVYAEEQGLDLRQLLDMVESSAKISHAHGNRRFHNWLFLVENNVVKRMQPIANAGHPVKINVPTPGPDEFLVWDECEECEGSGCQFCNLNGEVPVIRKIPKSANGVRRER